MRVGQFFLDTQKSPSWDLWGEGEEELSSSGWQVRHVPKHLEVQSSAPTAAPTSLWNVQMSLPGYSDLKAANLFTLFHSSATSEACSLIWADFLPSCVPFLASDSSSSLAPWACSFPSSLCSTFLPFKSSFPLFSHSWGSACCRVQSTEQLPWKKWRNWVSTASSSPSPALCTARVTSSGTPCLLLSLLSLVALRATEPWLHGPALRGVTMSGHPETRAAYLLFRGLQHYPQDSTARNLPN